MHPNPSAASAAYLLTCLNPRNLLLALLLLILYSPNLWAWPTDTDWVTLYKESNPLSDISADGATSRDIIGDATHPAVYLSNDNNYFYVRMRLNANPNDGGGGYLASFGWGILFDTDLDSTDYEYMFMIDGILQTEVMYLAKNTYQGTIYSPADKPEQVLWQDTLIEGVNFRVVPAGTVFPTGNPDPDFFLDWRIPDDIFKNSLGVTDTSIFRLFAGSSNNSMTLTADLVAGALANADANMSNSLTNPVTSVGTPPSTGTVSFVADLGGTIDLTTFYPGQTAYLKVVDADRNTLPSFVDTVTITVTAPSGDSQQVILHELIIGGVIQNGTFTGPLPTAFGSPVANDGILQVNPTELVKVEYIDATDADLLTNQIRSDLARALPAADLSLSKTVSNTTPGTNELITYTITLHNAGPSAATGIQITDNLPAGVTYVSDNGDGTYNPATGIWLAGNLSPTETDKSLRINVRVTAPLDTTVINTAEVTAAAQFDPDTGNNRDTVNFSVAGADLKISMSVSSLTPATGNSVTYTLVATNNGMANATGVIVHDQLPAGVLWSSDNSAGSYDHLSTHDWTIGNLAAGASRTLSIVVTVAGASGQTVTNTATIDGDQSDPDQGYPDTDNTATATFYIGATDLALSKSASPANPNENDVVTFTVTVVNPLSGNDTSGIVIHDLLPDGLTLLTTAPDAPAATQGSYNNASGNWSVGTLNKGGSATLTLKGRVNANSAGKTLTNTATISALASTDPNPANNTASASVTVQSCDIEISKWTDNSTPSGGGTIHFYVKAKNIGTNSAENIVVYDLLPTPQLTWSSDNSAGAYNRVTGMWSVGSLAAGAEKTLEITVTVYSPTGQDPTTFFNLAQLYSSTPGDRNPFNDVATQTISIGGTDLGLSKSVSNTTPSSGSSISFTITLSNYGPKAATGVTVEDVLPANLTCQSVSLTSTIGTAKCPNSGSTVSWKFGAQDSLAAGTPLAPVTASMTITALVGAAANGTKITNTADITTMAQNDSNMANNRASASFYVGASDLGLSKAVTGPIPGLPGVANETNTVNFTITLTNFGPNTVNLNDGASKVTKIKDLLPSGLTLVSAVPSVGSYDNNSASSSYGEWTFPANHTLAVNASVTLTMIATVDSNTAGTSLYNTATISTASVLDQNLGNNSATAVLRVQSADVYVTKTANKTAPYKGYPVVFTIHAGNNGEDDVTHLKVEDILDSDLTFTSYSASRGTYDSITGLWDIGSLAKNAAETLTINAVVKSTTSKSEIVNIARRYHADQKDLITTNDSEQVRLTPRNVQIDLVLEKSLTTPVPPTQPQEGGEMVFTLTLSNTSADLIASGLVVTDTLPAGLAFVSASTATGTFTAPAVGSAGDVIWSVGSLAAMSNVTLTITAKAACGAAGTTYTNSATISASEQADPDANNNTATANVTPTAVAPMLVVVKSSNIETAIPGDVVTYTVQLANSGCGAAANVEMKDDLSPYTAWRLSYNGSDPSPFLFTDSTPASGLTPGTTTYSNDGGSMWTYAPVPDTGDHATGFDGTVSNWRIPMSGTMRSGGQVILKYQVKVK